MHTMSLSKVHHRKRNIKGIRKQSSLEISIKDIRNGHNNES